jgi:hypothetical protein
VVTAPGAKLGPRTGAVQELMEVTLSRCSELRWIVEHVDVVVGDAPEREPSVARGQRNEEDR